jgi:hypothetical protein
MVVAPDESIWILTNNADSVDLNNNTPYVFHRDINNNTIPEGNNPNVGEGNITDIDNRIGERIVSSTFQGQQAIYVLMNDFNNGGLVIARISESGLGLPGGEFIPGQDLPGSAGALFLGVDLMNVGNSLVALAVYRPTQLGLPRPFIMGVLETQSEIEILWSEIVRPVGETSQLLSGLSVVPTAVARVQNGGYAITGFFGENVSPGESLSQTANIYLDQTDGFGRTEGFPENTDNFTTIEGWPKRFGGENGGGGRAIIFCSDGGIALTGSVTLEGDNSVVTMIKTNSNGELN